MGNSDETSVLVVGGAGYIGAQTCKSLSQAGFRPIVFDNLSTGHRAFVKWGPLIEADIRDHQAIANAIRKYKTSAVIHFAACALVGESVVAPDKYYDTNVIGSLSLLRGMREAGCSTLVLSSTCAVYGEHDSPQISEAVQTLPVNPYGASKLMVERIAADYRSAYGLRYICFRYFNACGADPESEIGEMHEPETHLIPRAMMALQGYIKDLAIYGNAFRTCDGTAVRDYIHVVDLAWSHVVALKRLFAGDAGGTFNLGTGRGYSVKQVLDAIAKQTGEHVNTVLAPHRPGDPAMLVADATLARSRLGLSPARSDLPTIIRTAWQWHKRAHPKRVSSATS